MASKQPNVVYCDLCGEETAFLSNLPCLKHVVCRDCAGKVSCFAPVIPEKCFYTCSICVVSTEENIEPLPEELEEEDDPLGIGIASNIANSRPSTPMPAESDYKITQNNLRQSGKAKNSFNPVKGSVNRIFSRSPVVKREDGPTQAGSKLVPWSATKSDSLDSLGSLRSSPCSLTQGDIIDMGVAALSHRSTASSQSRGAVTRTDGTFSPRALLKAQHQFHFKERMNCRNSPVLEKQSQLSSPSEKEISDENSQNWYENELAARYLFEDIPDADQPKDVSSGFLKKKHMRGMACQITPGANQRDKSIKIPIPVTSSKNKVMEKRQSGQKSVNCVASWTEEMHHNKGVSSSDLSGLNDDIEQLLKMPDRRPGGSLFPSTPLARQLGSSVQKPAVRKRASGSRYSTPDETIVLKKPAPNIESLTNSSIGLAKESKCKTLPFSRFGFGQYSDEDDYLGVISNQTKGGFDLKKLNRDVRNVWTHRGQDTQFTAVSDEDGEQEIERCTSPVKRMRGATRGRWVDESLDCSDDSMGRKSVTTRSDVEDLWDI